MTDIIFSSRTGLNYKRGTPEQGIVEDIRLYYFVGPWGISYSTLTQPILLHPHFGVNILKAKTDTDILARNSSFQKLVPESLENL